MFNKFRNQEPAGPQPQVQPKVKEAVPMSSKAKFFLWTAIIVAVMVSIFVIAPPVIEGVFANENAVRIEAETGLEQAKAESFRGEAEMLQAKQLSEQGEAEKWRGYAQAVMAWADPLQVFPNTLWAFGAVAAVIGFGFILVRVVWAMLRVAEVRTAAEIQVWQHQLLNSGQVPALAAGSPQVQIPAEVPKTTGKKHKFDPAVGVPKFLEGRGQEVGSEPSKTQK